MRKVNKMVKLKEQEDPFIGLNPFSDYCITKKIGEGKIGKVYKAIRENPYDELAYKIIPESKLKKGWERELQKVVLLRKVSGVVQYHSHGTCLDKNNRPFIWILWDYIGGINLREYLQKPAWPLDLAFIENISKIILNVLYACGAVKIEHGDLHEGNILISNPDIRLPDNPRTIWISDFGYGGSHNEIEPKDDYRQFFAIVSTLLRKLDPSNLNPRDKIFYQKLDKFIRKQILEVDYTQGRYVGNPKSLIKEFNRLATESEIESAAASRGKEIKGTGDYLVAEALGFKADEWKSLFVPEFLAAEDLLSRNITVLTGARGCGKTMVFRRLTAFMDKVIGEPSGVKGSDQFVGFYLNCRDLVEAFPWLPRKIIRGVQEQIIHYFHLAWCSEIFKTLAIYNTNKKSSFEWLDGFSSGLFGNKYHTLPKGSDILAHARAFIENEKEKCRTTDLGKVEGLKNWPLARIDFLDDLQTQIESHVSWIGLKPLYLFLDDYTIPIITKDVQRILNPIIFKRRDKLFFKVSTESANSFERESFRRKPLELNEDFELIDLATESIHQNINDKKILLEKIFIPRINRDPTLKGKNLGLEVIIGKTPFSNNQLARQMREAVQEGHRQSVVYHGMDAFVGMWASDMRIMIQIFTDMLRDSRNSINKGKYIIPEKIQDKAYRTAGGEFLVFTEFLVNPSVLKKIATKKKKGDIYGKHLRDIVEAFVNVSRYELTEGKLVKNEGILNPKQAFRLEIVDKFNLPDEILEYYEGLVRWHIFLQDWRGKSVRGMITPRLFLHRVLIPYTQLTFSSHDNIHLKNKELISLLKRPTAFFNYWKKKRKKKILENSKRTNGEQPTFWD